MATIAELNYAVDTFSSLGMSREAAMGALGSMMGESGRSLNTGAYNPNDPNGGSYGIAQWHSDRRWGMESFAKSRGKPKNDFKTQIDYVAKELKSTERNALKAMQKAKTLQEAARAWTNKFERPAAKYAHVDKRIANARYVADVLGGKKALTQEKAKKSLTQAQLATNAIAGVPDLEAETPGRFLGGIGRALSGMFGATPTTAPAVSLDDPSMTGGRFSGSLTPDGSPAPRKADGSVDYMAAAKQRNEWAAKNNPGVDYNAGLPGIQGPSPQQMNVHRGMRDPIGDMFKTVAMNAASGPIGVGMALAQSEAKRATGSVIADQKAKTDKGAKKGGFFGDPNSAAKIGAIGGGLIAGEMGAMVGGIVGQAIGRSMSNIGFDARLSASNFHSVDPSLTEFPDAPSMPSQNNNSGGGGGRDISPEAQAAVDSGKGGLY